MLGRSNALDLDSPAKPGRKLHKLEHLRGLKGIRAAFLKVAGEYTLQNAEQLSQELLGFINSLPWTVQNSEEVLQLIQDQLLHLHWFLSRVADETKVYLLDFHVRHILIKYVVLQPETAQERVSSLLWMVYCAYFRYSTGKYDALAICRLILKFLLNVRTTSSHLWDHFIEIEKEFRKTAPAKKPAKYHGVSYFCQKPPEPPQAPPVTVVDLTGDEPAKSADDLKYQEALDRMKKLRHDLVMQRKQQQRNCLITTSNLKRNTVICISDDDEDEEDQISRREIRNAVNEAADVLSKYNNREMTIKVQNDEVRIQIQSPDSPENSGTPEEEPESPPRSEMWPYCYAPPFQSMQSWYGYHPGDGRAYPRPLLDPWRTPTSHPPQWAHYPQTAQWVQPFRVMESPVHRVGRSIDSYSSQGSYHRYQHVESPELPSGPDHTPMVIEKEDEDEDMEPPPPEKTQMCKEPEQSVPPEVVQQPEEEPLDEDQLLSEHSDEYTETYTEVDQTVLLEEDPAPQAEPPSEEVPQSTEPGVLIIQDVVIKTAQPESVAEPFSDPPSETATVSSNQTVFETSEPQSETVFASDTRSTYPETTPPELPEARNNLLWLSNVILSIPPPDLAAVPEPEETAKEVETSTFDHPASEDVDYAQEIEVEETVQDAPEDGLYETDIQEPSEKDLEVSTDIETLKPTKVPETYLQSPTENKVLPHPGFSLLRYETAEAQRTETTDSSDSEIRLKIDETGDSSPEHLLVAPVRPYRTKAEMKQGTTKIPSDDSDDDIPLKFHKGTRSRGRKPSSSPRGRKRNGSGRRKTEPQAFYTSKLRSRSQSTGKEEVSLENVAPPKPRGRPKKIQPLSNPPEPTTLIETVLVTSKTLLVEESCATLNLATTPPKKRMAVLRKMNKLLDDTTKRLKERQAVFEDNEEVFTFESDKILEVQQEVEIVMTEKKTKVNDRVLRSSKELDVPPDEECLSLKRTSEVLEKSKLGQKAKSSKSSSKAEFLHPDSTPKQLIGTLKKSKKSLKFAKNEDNFISSDTSPHQILDMQLDGSWKKSKKTSLNSLIAASESVENLSKSSKTFINKPELDGPANKSILDLDASSIDPTTKPSNNSELPDLDHPCQKIKFCKSSSKSPSRSQLPLDFKVSKTLDETAKKSRRSSNSQTVENEESAEINLEPPESNIQTVENVNTRKSSKLEKTSKKARRSLSNSSSQIRLKQPEESSTKKWRNSQSVEKEAANGQTVDLEVSDLNLTHLENNSNSQIIEKDPVRSTSKPPSRLQLPKHQPLDFKTAISKKSRRPSNSKIIETEPEKSPLTSNKQTLDFEAAEISLKELEKTSKKSRRSSNSQIVDYTAEDHSSRMKASRTSYQQKQPSEVNLEISNNQIVKSKRSSSKSPNRMQSPRATYDQTVDFESSKKARKSSDSQIVESEPETAAGESLDLKNTEMKFKQPEKSKKPVGKDPVRSFSKSPSRMPSKAQTLDLEASRKKKSKKSSNSQFVENELAVSSKQALDLEVNEISSKQQEKSMKKPRRPSHSQIMEKEPVRSSNLEMETPESKVEQPEEGSKKSKKPSQSILNEPIKTSDSNEKKSRRFSNSKVVENEPVKTLSRSGNSEQQDSSKKSMTSSDSQETEVSTSNLEEFSAKQVVDDEPEKKQQPEQFLKRSNKKSNNLNVQFELPEVDLSGKKIKPSIKKSGLKPSSDSDKSKEPSNGQLELPEMDLWGQKIKSEVSNKSKSLNLLDTTGKKSKDLKESSITDDECAQKPKDLIASGEMEESKTDPKPLEGSSKKSKDLKETSKQSKSSRSKPTKRTASDLSCNTLESLKDSLEVPLKKSKKNKEDNKSKLLDECKNSIDLEADTKLEVKKSRKTSHQDVKAKDQLDSKASSKDHIEKDSKLVVPNKKSRKGKEPSKDFKELITLQSQKDEKGSQRKEESKTGDEQTTSGKLKTSAKHSEELKETPNDSSETEEDLKPLAPENSTITNQLSKVSEETPSKDQRKVVDAALGHMESSAKPSNELKETSNTLKTEEGLPHSKPLNVPKKTSTTVDDASKCSNLLETTPEVQSEEVVVNVEETRSGQLEDLTETSMEKEAAKTEEDLCSKQFDTPKSKSTKENLLETSEVQSGEEEKNKDAFEGTNDKAMQLETKTSEDTPNVSLKNEGDPKKRTLKVLSSSKSKKEEQDRDTLNSQKSDESNVVAEADLIKTSKGTEDNLSVEEPHSVQLVLPKEKSTIVQETSKISEEKLMLGIQSQESGKDSEKNRESPISDGVSNFDSTKKTEETPNIPLKAGENLLHLPKKKSTKVTSKEMSSSSVTLEVPLDREKKKAKTTDSEGKKELSVAGEESKSGQLESSTKTSIELEADKEGIPKKKSKEASKELSNSTEVQTEKKEPDSQKEKLTAVGSGQLEETPNIPLKSEEDPAQLNPPKKRRKVKENSKEFTTLENHQGTEEENKDTLYSQKKEESNVTVAELEHSIKTSKVAEDTLNITLTTEEDLTQLKQFDLPKKSTKVNEASMNSVLNIEEDTSRKEDTNKSISGKETPDKLKAKPLSKTKSRILKETSRSSKLLPVEEKSNIQMKIESIEDTGTESSKLNDSSKTSKVSEDAPNSRLKIEDEVVGKKRRKVKETSKTSKGHSVEESESDSSNSESRQTAGTAEPLQNSITSEELTHQQKLDVPLTSSKELLVNVEDAQVAFRKFETLNSHTETEELLGNLIPPEALKASSSNQANSELKQPQVSDKEFKKGKETSENSLKLLEVKIETMRGLALLSNAEEHSDLNRKSKRVKEDSLEEPTKVQKKEEFSAAFEVSSKNMDEEVQNSSKESKEEPKSVELTTRKVRKLKDSLKRKESSSTKEDVPSSQIETEVDLSSNIVLIEMATSKPEKMKKVEKESTLLAQSRTDSKNSEKEKKINKSPKEDISATMLSFNSTFKRQSFEDGSLTRISGLEKTLEDSLKQPSTPKSLEITPEVQQATMQKPEPSEMSVYENIDYGTEEIVEHSSMPMDLSVLKPTESQSPIKECSELPKITCNQRPLESPPKTIRKHSIEETVLKLKQQICKIAITTNAESSEQLRTEPAEAQIKPTINTAPESTTAELFSEPLMDDSTVKPQLPEASEELRSSMNSDQNNDSEQIVSMAVELCEAVDFPVTKELDSQEEGECLQNQKTLTVSTLDSSESDMPSKTRRLSDSPTTNATHSFKSIVDFLRLDITESLVDVARHSDEKPESIDSVTPVDSSEKMTESLVKATEISEPVADQKSPIISCEVSVAGDSAELQPELLDEEPEKSAKSEETLKPVEHQLTMEIVPPASDEDSESYEREENAIKAEPEFKHVTAEEDTLDSPKYEELNSELSTSGKELVDPLECERRQEKVNLEMDNATEFAETTLDQLKEIKAQQVTGKAQNQSQSGSLEAAACVPVVSNSSELTTNASSETEKLESADSLNVTETETFAELKTTNVTLEITQKSSEAQEDSISCSESSDPASTENSMHPIECLVPDFDNELLITDDSLSQDPLKISDVLNEVEVSSIALNEETVWIPKVQVEFLPQIQHHEVEKEFDEVKISQPIHKVEEGLKAGEEVLLPAPDYSRKKKKKRRRRSEDRSREDSKRSDEPKNVKDKKSEPTKEVKKDVADRKNSRSEHRNDSEARRSSSKTKDKDKEKELNKSRSSDDLSKKVESKNDQRKRKKDDPEKEDRHDSKKVKTSSSKDAKEDGGKKSSIKEEERGSSKSSSKDVQKKRDKRQEPQTGENKLKLAQNQEESSNVAEVPDTKAILEKVTEATDAGKSLDDTTQPEDSGPKMSDNTMSIVDQSIVLTGTVEEEPEIPNPDNTQVSLNVLEANVEDVNTGIHNTEVLSEDDLSKITQPSSVNQVTVEPQISVLDEVRKAAVDQSVVQLEDKTENGLIQSVNTIIKPPTDEKTVELDVVTHTLTSQILPEDLVGSTPNKRKSSETLEDFPLKKVKEEEQACVGIPSEFIVDLKGAQPEACLEDTKILIEDLSSLPSYFFLHNDFTGITETVASSSVPYVDFAFEHVTTDTSSESFTPNTRGECVITNSVATTLPQNTGTEFDDFKVSGDHSYADAVKSQDSLGNLSEATAKKNRDIDPNTSMDQWISGLLQPSEAENVLEKPSINIGDPMASVALEDDNNWPASLDSSYSGLENLEHYIEDSTTEYSVLENFSLEDDDFEIGPLQKKLQDIATFEQPTEIVQPKKPPPKPAKPQVTYVTVPVGMSTRNNPHKQITVRPLQDMVTQKSKNVPDNYMEDSSTSESSYSSMEIEFGANERHFNIQISPTTGETVVLPTPVVKPTSKNPPGRKRPQPKAAQKTPALLAVPVRVSEKTKPCPPPPKKKVTSPQIQANNPRVHRSMNSYMPPPVQEPCTVSESVKPLNKPRKSPKPAKSFKSMPTLTVENASSSSSSTFDLLKNGLINPIFEERLRASKGLDKPVVEKPYTRASKPTLATKPNESDTKPAAKSATNKSQSKDEDWMERFAEELKKRGRSESCL